MSKRAISIPEASKVKYTNFASKDNHPGSGGFYAIEIVGHEENCPFSCRSLQAAQYGRPDFCSSTLNLRATTR